jgi:hypothetical protein
MNSQTKKTLLICFLLFILSFGLEILIGNHTVDCSSDLSYGMGHFLRQLPNWALLSYFSRVLIPSIFFTSIFIYFAQRLSKNNWQNKALRILKLTLYLIGTYFIINIILKYLEDNFSIAMVLEQILIFSCIVIGVKGVYLIKPQLGLSFKRP